ncbi:MAG: c-type cytochrome [Burkholderiaceae bacterium]|nr:c-type cytochrome [Burkholderiaceae bacterium]
MNRAERVALRASSAPRSRAAHTQAPRAFALLALALAFAFALGACSDPALQHLSASEANGRLLLQQFGCGDCHTIPGVANARGNVGPPLTHVARRVYLAGRVPNRRETMEQWIQDPKRFDPLTEMPDLQVGEAHARDMVAYLYTLR